MLKVNIIEDHPPISSTFPALYILPSSSLIVLFDTPTSGMVLREGESFNTVGQYRDFTDCLDTTHWERYTGTLELLNS